MTRQPSVTANEAAERLLDALSELWNNDDDQPTGTTAHALVVAALRTERLRVVEQVRERAVLASDDYSDDDHKYAEIPLADFLAILAAVAGLSGEEPSDG